MRQHDKNNEEQKIKKKKKISLRFIVNTFLFCGYNYYARQSTSTLKIYRHQFVSIARPSPLLPTTFVVVVTIDSVCCCCSVSADFVYFFQCIAFVSFLVEHVSMNATEKNETKWAEKQMVPTYTWIIHNFFSAFQFRQIVVKLCASNGFLLLFLFVAYYFLIAHFVDLCRFQCGISLCYFFYIFVCHYKSQ